MPSFSFKSWNTPPSEEAPKLRDDTFIPVFPISWYCIRIGFKIILYATKVRGEPFSTDKRGAKKLRNGLRKKSFFKCGNLSGNMLSLQINLSWRPSDGKPETYFTQRPRPSIRRIHPYCIPSTERQPGNQP